MTATEIYDKLKNEFANDIISLTEEANVDPFILVNSSRITEICLYLRDEADMNFDYLVNLSGVDYKTNFTVVYHLYSLKLKHRIVLKVELSPEKPSVTTVEKVWKTANWHEREAYDMFGIVFEGHPFMVRILCPYDWEGFPLRKDYKEPEFYRGNKVAN
ncbi:MAG: NADH-quinone oxidoreductase subunit C [Candidatus Kapabacteria bacterium]|jgi:NADH-quinone oxidoreductase subunit C|nr:NADH-quinone oxidoreductase subunit C [Candidatus Kapabacteria bacterium]